MACMCGDPYCSSCGPAQGFDPSYEVAYDDTYDKIVAIFTKHGRPLEVYDNAEDHKIIDELTELALAHARDAWSAREAGFFECIDRIERLYQTRERTVKTIRGDRTITDNPRITNPYDVELLRNVVADLKGNG